MKLEASRPIRTRRSSALEEPIGTGAGSIDIVSRAPRSPFLMASRATGLTPADLAKMAPWFGAEVHPRRPAPKDRVGLVLNADAVRLCVPGLPPLTWHPGTAYLRLRDGDGPLPRVMGLRPGETVLDATLGLGHDTLVLAHAQAHVLGLDTVAPLLFFTLDGIRRFAPTLSRRVTVRRAEHGRWLREAPSRSVDHIYLDPMFPPALGSQSHTLSVLRALATGRRPTASILRDACRVARRNVVMKLAPSEPPLWVPGLPKPHVEGSKRVHFGVWRCGGDD